MNKNPIITHIKMLLLNTALTGKPHIIKAVSDAEESFLMSLIKVCLDILMDTAPTEISLVLSDLMIKSDNSIIVIMPYSIAERLAEGNAIIYKTNILNYLLDEESPPLLEIDVEKINEKELQTIQQYCLAKKIKTILDKENKRIIFKKE